jgi:hypothetical protein
MENQGRKAIALAAIGICALVFSLTQIQYSFQHGRLAMPPVFDDVVYFDDALGRVDVLYNQGWCALFADAITAPPHSPYSTLVAMSGFMIFGMHDWAPYLMNTLLLAAYLWIALDLMSGTRLWERSVILLFVLSIPLAGNMVIQGRPDLAWGLAAAMAVLTPLRSPLVGSSWRHQLVVGGWCAAALLAKPTTFPLTLLSTFMAWTLASWCDWTAYRQVHFFRPLARAWAVCSVTVLALAVPYYLVNCRHILQYTFYVVAGNGRLTAELPPSWLFRMDYFLHGDGGRQILHHHLYILAAVIAAGAIVVTIRARAGPEDRQRFLRAACLGLITLVTYLVPTMVGIKNPFFAMQFHVLLVLGGVWVMRMFLVHGREWGIGWSRFLPLTLGTAAGGVFWPLIPVGPEGSTAAAYNRVIAGVTSAVLDHAPPHSRVFLTGSGWLNAQQLTYLGWKHDNPLDASDRSYSSDLADEVHGFDESDFVVAADSRVGEFYNFLPAAAVQDQSLASIRQRGDFQLVATVPSETGGKFYVFQRPPKFGDWEEATNLGPEEGPYPQWQLPVVRWGYYPSVSLTVRASSAGTYRLRAGTRAQVDGQEITILLDGRAAAHHIFTQTSRFEDLEVPLNLAAGGHELDLKFAKYQTLAYGQRPGGALFERLQFLPDNQQADAAAPR